MIRKGEPIKADEDICARCLRVVKAKDIRPVRTGSAGERGATVPVFADLCPDCADRVH